MAELALPEWDHQYRIVSSEFPPIDFYESLVDADLMEELFYIEGLTNDRLREEVGEIALVAPEDRVSGPCSSPVMAAFTHIGVESRFSDGSFGVYYAGESLGTSIAETKFHRERFLAYTNEEPGEIDMRSYIGEIVKPMHDIRGGFDELHNPDVGSYPIAQKFGRKKKSENSWGIVYRSVRNPGGECIAVLRPPAITIPRQGPHLSYVWDGSRIVRIYEKRLII
ncbi:MAG: RES family NAD+ phosphorylase [Gammaproteobacteria bacterium]|nr:RES family NAD+ phosphorylase [Gammaproteobacteria bacterium]MCP5409231.1 RES family NAD+ phosphorylase [Chromatiaceae bacterium]MCP5444637.1 RES family NAD+ phosphorylase [Chromatiaceae bacterium]